jgi:hypothetical protein
MYYNEGEYNFIGVGRETAPPLLGHWEDQTKSGQAAIPTIKATPQK